MCVCTRIRLVAAAANESATNGSRAWCPPPASHLMSGAGWSVTKHASKPASSAVRAHVITASPVTSSSAWATRSVGNPIVKRIPRKLGQERAEAIGGRVVLLHRQVGHQPELVQEHGEPHHDRRRPER